MVELTDEKIMLSMVYLENRDTKEDIMDTIRNNSSAKEYSDNLYEVIFTPVLDRPEYQEEPIHGFLLTLRDKMGEEDFDLYINSLIRITFNGKALWLITKKERNRTIIEGKYLPMIKEVFGATSVRVFSQA